MSIRERRCYEVECDRCDDAWPHRDYGTPHFAAATPEQAEVKVIASFGWVRHPKHGLICDVCASAALCEEQDGHLWDAWSPGVLYRVCRRCSAADRRDGVSVVTLEIGP